MQSCDYLRNEEIESDIWNSPFLSYIEQNERQIWWCHLFLLTLQREDTMCDHWHTMRACVAGVRPYKSDRHKIFEKRYALSCKLKT